MVSTALASTLARRNIHYGWVVVAATFLTMLVTWRHGRTRRSHQAAAG